VLLHLLLRVAGMIPWQAMTKHVTTKLDDDKREGARSAAEAQGMAMEDHLEDCRQAARRRILSAAAGAPRQENWNGKLGVPN
jgi:hypothetical protein